MRINKLKIENFRAISLLELKNLREVVVIAGPNGCGKSAIFDALRFLKSIYGGYQPNEVQQWLSEFHIRIDEKQTELLNIFQDRSKELRIRAEFCLEGSEQEWLKKNANDLSRESVWRNPSALIGTHLTGQSLAKQLRNKAATVAKQSREDAELLTQELSGTSFIAEVVVSPDGDLGVERSILAETVFGIYDPQNIGIIDLHSAQRSFDREQFGGINLNIESEEQRVRQHALYNYKNKYQNIKSEMASAFIRELLAKESGENISTDSTLNSALRELFSIFFDGKTFLGPQPTASGGLSFNVQLSNGAIHDMNELSSGEKEVLFGYLRLQNSSPRNCVLLIDEPELHLNPRLTEGLPDFYHRHLGKSGNNQIWLVTHSDSILRQAVGRENFDVYHMLPSTTVAAGTNQLTHLLVEEELQRAIVDLVGDLATYRPGTKIVLLEGGGVTEFDTKMVSGLFPELRGKVTFISGGNKKGVRDLHRVFKKARECGAATADVYSIADPDFELDTSDLPEQVYEWDRFHIENYLLDSDSILHVIRNLDIPALRDYDKALLEADLVVCAEQTRPQLVRHRLTHKANNLIVEALNTKIDPNSTRLVDDLRVVIEASVSRIQRVAEGQLSSMALSEDEKKWNERLSQDLTTGGWKHTFRGRDILKRFVDKKLEGRVSYEIFRNLVLARMCEDDRKPEGMKAVIDRILAEPELSAIANG